RIVFLDEPTGGVDALSRREFWRLIDHLAGSGVTVLVKTHYLDEAEHCNRVAIIHAGRLAALGTTSELKALFADRPIVEVPAGSPPGAGGAAARHAAVGGEDQRFRHGRARGVETRDRRRHAADRDQARAIRHSRRRHRAGPAIARGRLPRGRGTRGASMNMLEPFSLLHDTQRVDVTVVVERFISAGGVRR